MKRENFMQKPEQPMLIKQENNTLSLIAQTDFIITHSDILQKQMLKALSESKEGEVLLDLSQIQFVDSVGLKLVIGLLNTCTEKGLDFKVEVSSPSILKLFDMCKLSSLLDVRETAANG